MSENRIWIGDFNMVFDSGNDRIGSYYNKVKSKEAVLSIMDELLMEDVWRLMNPEAKVYSWLKRQKGKLFASRIDFAMISRSLVQRTEQTMYLPGVRTDHSAVYLCIGTEVNEREKGYWKMNISLFRNKEFVSLISETIEEVKLQMQDKPIQD